MCRRVVFFYLIFSLLLVQISGLHLHLCSGHDIGNDHPVAHYADGGLFFGEDHADDDVDDREASLPAATFTAANHAEHQLNFDLGLTWVVYVVPTIEIRSAAGDVRSTRTSSTVPPSSRSFDLPPARGLPSFS